MKVRFHGTDGKGPWRPVIAEVADENEFFELTQVREGKAPIEDRTIWEDTNTPTGVMVNFCIRFNCNLCKGRTA